MKTGTKTESILLGTARAAAATIPSATPPAMAASCPPSSESATLPTTKVAPPTDPGPTGGQAPTASLPEYDRSRIPAEILGSAEPVLLAFRTAWSRPCDVLDGVLSEVETALGSRVKVFRINADDYPELSLWYDIHSIPTLLCFVSGRVRFTIVGTVSKETLFAKLAALGNASSPGSL